ncbi:MULTISPECIES: hypothetical protein [unclassified Erwinia]|uniref:hypothetical protein n=1 Tax=unclassified Erwinia TaxID=2622719 RepID=UPI001304219A|nr:MULTISPECIES: hypothetical protein [unclassified Erwinia]
MSATADNLYFTAPNRVEFDFFNVLVDNQMAPGAEIHQGVPVFKRPVVVDHTPGYEASATVADPISFGTIERGTTGQTVKFIEAKSPNATLKVGCNGKSPDVVATCQADGLAVELDGRQGTATIKTNDAHGPVSIPITVGISVE